MNDAIARAEIKRYVDKAYLAKLMQMNDQRLQRNGDLYVTLHKGGHSRNSSACVLGEVDIEEALMAELLHQTAELYIDAYERKGLKIGPEVMKDLAEKQVGVVATRKASLMAQAQPSRVRELWKEHVVDKASGKGPEVLLEQHEKIETLSEDRHAIVHGMWDYSKSELEKITVWRLRKGAVEKKVFTADALMNISLAVDQINYYLRFPLDNPLEISGSFMSRRMRATLAGHPVSKELWPRTDSCDVKTDR